MALLINSNQAIKKLRPYIAVQIKLGVHLAFYIYLLVVLCSSQVPLGYNFIYKISKDTHA